MPISEIYFGDNMHYMATIPDKFFDLAIPDPNYGISVGKMAFTQATDKPALQKNGSKLIVKKAPIPKSDWDDKPATQEFFNEIVRVSKHQIIWGINYFDWVGVGPGRIRWDKCTAEGVSFSRYEYAYCSLIDYEMTIPYMWAGMLQAKSISEPTTQQGNKRLNEKRIHVCHKPVNLYKILLSKFAQPRFKILDSNVGSQSSRIAAYEMGFDYYGCELDKYTFERGNKRFELFKSQTKLQF